MKSDFPNSPASRKRKFALWIFWVLVGYAIIGFLILPPIVRVVAVKQTSKQLDREVSIQKIKINPFALSTTIRGLLIKETDGQPFVSWDEVYVNFQLSSFFGHAWVFKKISTTKPFVRAQMNKDGTFNFTDLIAKFSTNTASAAPKKASAPLALRIDRLQIRGASASFTDLTPRTAFTRVIGPLDVTLENFRTASDNKNPYAFSGTTDAGETFSWSGFFYLDPLRSQGTLTLNKVTLNKYAALYQDLVRFEIRSGQVAMRADYNFELSATNRLAAVTNTAFALRDFTLAEPGASNNLAEVVLFDVTGASVDLQSRQADIGSVFAYGGKLSLQRNADSSINVVELAKPAEDLTNAPGGILFLLHSVTNVVAMLLNSTNQWSATIHDVDFTNCALHLEDNVNSRPARLNLDEITLAAKNISNIPTTNLTTSLSLRWNTNGTINTKIAASFAPPTAEIQLALTNLDLGTLDPYLEPKLNLLILGSKLGLDGELHLRTPKDELPQVTFHGNARLDDFHTVDGAMGEDLLKWDSVRVSGIDANLNPQTVSIKQIAVDNLYARVVVESNHSVNLLTALRMTNTNAPTATNETKIVKTKSPAFAKNSAVPATNAFSLPDISIGSIVISNAAIRYTDYSMKPNVNLTIEQASGMIAGISSKELQHGDVNFHALVDNVGPADITGHINPFSGTQTNEIKIAIKDVDLTPTSPYGAKFAGYGIAEGKLNMDLTYEIVGRKLKSKNVITLDHFTFGEKVNSTDATHLPVRLAVAILKDRDGKIVLDVPIDGSLDDPQMRVGKVVTRAVVNILEKVATSPFSLLGALFGGGEELSYQDFAPGSAALSPDNVKKLDSLVKGLYARPGLNLEISGSVDPVSDRDGLQRASLDRQLRARKWLTLRKSERATNTVDQVTLTPDERQSLVKKLYHEALADGRITPAIIAANTNLAVIAAQVPSRSSKIDKGATFLVKKSEPAAAKSSTISAQPKLAAIADPVEALLAAVIPVSDSDLTTLAADRAKAVRAYILQTGKVEATRIFLIENQMTGVRSDGSRAYLQFR